MMNPRAKIKCHPGSKKISKVLRDEPKIKKYQSDDEPKSQDQMSKIISKGRYPGSIKISKVLKRRIRNKKNIKVMDPRAKSQIKCQRSKDINGMIPQVKKKYQRDDTPDQ